jgi:hypothetical protein
MMTRKMWRCAVAGAVVLCAGCNPFALYQHRHTGYDFYGEHDITYYHYPGGAWFVPRQQRHHCPVITEQPFHGFQQTCWTVFPEPLPCPPPVRCEPPVVEIVPSPVPTPVVPPPVMPPVEPKEGAAPTNAPFYGAHGFSGPDDGEGKPAVAVELLE